MQRVAFTGNNRLALLHCGAEFFPELIKACDAAQSEIHLETYIFADDPTGNAVRDALTRAAARGVRVMVITDWVGTGRAESEKLHEALRQAGVMHRSFNPWFRRGFVRTHRKICVIDGKTAFLGGLNINDDLISDDDAAAPLPAPRWDFAVRIDGPLVQAVQTEVVIQWLRLGRQKLRSRIEQLRRMRTRHVEKEEDAPSYAALVVRDNLRNRRTIERATLHALGHARESAWLANPYFAPGRKLRVALTRAAERGVDVSLLLGVGQFHIQDAVARSYYPKLLKSGVKIYEYQRTQLHGKVATIDRDWSTVGSSNYDGFSLFVNQEANIVIRDDEFACALREHIGNGIRDAVRIRPEDFGRAPWYRRLWYGAAFLLYRGVLQMITMGRYG
jgi:cardiolipin synthase